jgi:hypothetical protein
MTASEIQFLRDEETRLANQLAAGSPDPINLERYLTFVRQKLAHAPAPVSPE